MLQRIFIANRGEIALRIARTVRRLGLQALGGFSSVDGGLPHLRLCARAMPLLGDPARVYLDIDQLIDTARSLGADAVHPGYGFLAENEDFASAVESAGMAFIGPTPDQIVALGDKVQARKAAERAGVPIVPGHSETIADVKTAQDIAARIGYPVLIKAAGGGGGRGMRIVDAAENLPDALARAQSEAKASFNDDRVFIEKYIARARHVEIQVLGDGRGNAVSLGERECSVQRRHQKLIEESPAPAVPPEVATRMGVLAAALAASVKYRGAGTMEFIVPFGGTDFYFIEMNTRLQVEHPVTELMTGLDLVEEQLAIASGAGFSKAAASAKISGHAIEARVIAENPYAGFQPSIGALNVVQFPAGPGIRVDSWAEPGLAVSPHYDSLLAKILAWGPTREVAIARLRGALNETLIHPVQTTAGFLAEFISGADFSSGHYDTGTIERWRAPDGENLPAELAALAEAEKLSRQGSTSGALPRQRARPMGRWQQSN